MSISIKFNNNLFSLDKLKLPTRYYFFNCQQKYIKLLSVGDGIFPGDKINTSISLNNSDLLATTESAIKVHPTNDQFAKNRIDISLSDSNLEFINDEMILYKNSKFLQLLKIKANDKSTFFYVDILSQGRSFENFDFTKMNIKNSFYINGEIEYLEKYQKNGLNLQQYMIRNNCHNTNLAKVYIKIDNNVDFLEI